MASFQISPRFDFGRGFAQLSKNLRGFLVTLSSAFDSTTGHSHGATGHGAPIVAGGLATTPGLFDTPGATVVQDHDDGGIKTLLAANGAGSGDRLVLVQATVTEAFVTTSWQIDCGSPSDPNGLFADIFAGVADLAIGENVIGLYNLPEEELLGATETAMVGDTAGKISYRVIIITPNLTAGNIEALAVDTAELAAGAVTDAKIDSKITKDPGRIAHGVIDFGAEGTENCTVTIGAVTYAEEHTAPDVTVGEWDNGGSAAVSATNLTAAINGDQRNAGGPSYAAVVIDTTVHVFALVAGTAGNVAVSASEASPDVTDNLIDGVAAVVKQTVVLDHIVTTEEGTQVECFIPLPFDPVSATVTVRSSAGALIAITDFVTLVAAAGTVPAHIKIVTNGGTNIAATNVVSVVAQE